MVQQMTRYKTDQIENLNLNGSMPLPGPKVDYETDPIGPDNKTTNWNKLASQLASCREILSNWGQINLGREKRPVTESVILINVSSPGSAFEVLSFPAVGATAIPENRAFRAWPSSPLNLQF